MTGLALITRPRADSDGLADQLRQRGFEPLIEPLLDIVFLPGAKPEREGTQGILATSANGVRALAVRLGDSLADWRDLPLWAVGDASAKAARQAGFTRVASADGDVDSLAALVAAEADPKKGRLLQAAATQLAGDLAGQLGKSGFVIDKQVLYEARPAAALSERTIAAIEQGQMVLALFFSPRTAGLFVRLAGALNCAKVTAAALSPAVAAALAGLDWKRVIIAERPRQDSLLAALDGV